MSNFADSLYRSIIVNKTVKKWNGYANGYAMGMQWVCSIKNKMFPMGMQWVCKLPVFFY